MRRLLHWTLLQLRRRVYGLGIREESGIRCGRGNVSIEEAQTFLLNGGVQVRCLFFPGCPFLLAPPECGGCGCVYSICPSPCPTVS